MNLVIQVTLVFLRNLLIPVNLVISGIKFILLNQINLAGDSGVYGHSCDFGDSILLANQMLLVNVTMT